MTHYNVMFLCTGNSARSIMAEAIMNRKGGANFTAYSAGSHPAGAVRPEAIRQIQSAGLSAANARSKSWMSSQPLKRPISISSSQFVTTRPRKYAHYGQASQ